MSITYNSDRMNLVLETKLGIQDNTGLADFTKTANMYSLTAVGKYTNVRRELVTAIGFCF